MQSTLKAGWAQVDITPMEPVILTGQFHARVSEGVKDALTATALALESAPAGEPEARVVMVSCDLLSVSECIQEAVRRHLAVELPELAPYDVVFNATHTHTAPYHYSRPRYRPETQPEEHPYGIALSVMSGRDYVAFVSRRLASAIVEAWHQRQPAGFAYGLGYAVAARNRLMAYRDGTARMYGGVATPEFSHVEGYEDHSVQVAGFYRPDGRLTGVIVNLPCTAQVEGGGWEVSADYWHEARQLLRDRHGDDLFVLPQVSAAGDQAPKGPLERSAQERMAQLAGRTMRQEVAARIVNAIDQTLALIQDEVNWAPTVVHRADMLDLPRRSLSAEDVREALAESERHRPEYERLLAELEANPQAREVPRWYQALSKAYRLIKRGEAVEERYRLQQQSPFLTVEVHAIRLGDIGMVTNPFELYLDYGMRIRERSRAIQTFVVQLAGPGSYVPTARSIAGGAYGAVPASTEIGVEGGEALVEWSVQALEALMTSDEPVRE